MGRECGLGFSKEPRRGKTDRTDSREKRKIWPHSGRRGPLSFGDPDKKGALSKSWLVRFKGAGGRWREAGLGKFPEVSLAPARERAAAMRETASSGHDPLEERDATRAEIVVAQEAAKVAIEKPVTYG